MARANATDRFWAKVEKTEGCWRWTGSTQTGRPAPYGFFCYSGLVKMAHRVCWEIHYGPIPEGLQVLHHCDNTLCVNPAHLFLGTHQDNMDDRRQKGREAKGRRHGRNTMPERSARGVGHGMVRITEETVRQIRACYAAGGIKFRDLGALFGITGTQAHRIVRRKCWAHVT